MEEDEDADAESEVDAEFDAGIAPEEGFLATPEAPTVRFPTTVRNTLSRSFRMGKEWASWAVYGSEQDADAVLDTAAEAEVGAVAASRSENGETLARPKLPVSLQTQLRSGGSHLRLRRASTCTGDMSQGSMGGLNLRRRTWEGGDTTDLKNEVRPRVTCQSPSAPSHPSPV